MVLLVVGMVAALAVALPRAKSRIAPTEGVERSDSRAPDPPAASPSVSGQASVVDGDTIEIHGTRVRLDGIDAPESGQWCEASGKQYRCGQMSAFALSDLIASKVVHCVETSRDRWRRMVAVCTVGNVDIGAWLVQSGWAIAYRKYSMKYVEIEGVAKSKKLGMWAGQFDAPEEWRRRKSGGH